MTLQELPPEHWSLITPEMPIYGLLPFLEPEWTRILAVVDDEGYIIGTQAIFSIRHAEGLWIHPDHRGKSAVQRLLLKGMSEALADAEGVMTASDTPEVEGIIRKLGGVELTTKAFYLPLKGVLSLSKEGG